MTIDTDVVPMPNDAQLSPENRELLKQLPPVNVFRMMANVPQSLHPFVAFSKSLIQEGKLSPRLREIAILRTAMQLDSQYEWELHVPIAKKVGLSEPEIKIIHTETPVKSLTMEENFICEIADELTLQANLTDATFKKLYSQYSIEIASELILGISATNMISRYVNATRVPKDHNKYV